MTCPSSCHDPNCTLTYAAHGFPGILSPAMPTRKPETYATHVREQRWERDHPAFDRLTAQGYDVPELDGARARERYAQNDTDIEHGVVLHDWEDPT